MARHRAWREIRGTADSNPERRRRVESARHNDEAVRSVYDLYRTAITMVSGTSQNAAACPRRGRQRSVIYGRQSRRRR